MILPFRQFNAKILPALNRLVNKVNELDNMRGDDFINIKRSGAGTTVGLNLGQARQRLSRKRDNDVGGQTVRRASCTADAGAGSTIAATLYKSDGTTGDAITVYCNISNGTALNSAVPRLEIGDNIFVTKSTYDNSGTPEVRWYCVTNFNLSNNCVCTES
jgi:hypothetical protein